VRPTRCTKSSASLGHVEVDDVSDVGDIDAAGGDVGGDEDAMASVREAGQSGVALGLGAVAVNLRGGMAGADESTGDAIGAVLGAHEDKETAVVRSEQMLEELLFLVGGDFKGLQLDVRRGLEDRADFDADRILEVVAGYVADFRTQRSRVTEGLAIGGQSSGDASNGGLEAHVEHAVDLVENEDFDAAEVDEPAVEVVFERPGWRR